MPVLESHKVWYNEAATDVVQPYDPRIFKSHLTLRQLQEFGIAPPFADTTCTSLISDRIENIPSPLAIQYPRIIFCWRSRADALYSLWRYLPPFAHVHPDRIDVDWFVHVLLDIMSETPRLQSLVDHWHLRHHPNILVRYVLTLNSNDV
jgi:hypothetical protein